MRSTCTKSKRSLEFRSGGKDLDLLEAVSGEGMAAKKIKSGENDSWNEAHCMLVRDLEKKGIVGRYGVKHLKLWTDLTVQGKSAGIGEEPNWDDYQSHLQDRLPRLRSQTQIQQQLMIS